MTVHYFSDGSPNPLFLIWAGENSFSYRDICLYDDLDIWKNTILVSKGDVFVIDPERQDTARYLSYTYPRNRIIII